MPGWMRTTAMLRNNDGEVGRVGYEINFNRYFYRYRKRVPGDPRQTLEEIDRLS